MGLFFNSKAPYAIHIRGKRSKTKEHRCKTEYL